MDAVNDGLGRTITVELMWLTGRLAPDFKTIADFRRDNGRGIRQTCSQFLAI